MPGTPGPRTSTRYYMTYLGAQCPVPAEPRRPDGLVPVFDMDADQVILVPLAEARAGMVRYARTLGPGSPAAGVWEQRALSLRGGPELDPETEQLYREEQQS